MAYNESGEIPVSQSTYSLGGYTFELKVQNVHEPGEEEVTSIFAICRGPDGTRETQAIDFPAGTTVESWSVEANETEASVYVEIAGTGINAIESTADGEHIWGGFYRCTATPCIALNQQGATVYLTWYGNNIFHAACTTDRIGILVGPDTFVGNYVSANRSNYFSSALGVTHPEIQKAGIPESTTNPKGKPISAVDMSGNYLVGRFAIDIREADGGPDGPWDEPGDTGDPSYTLNVYVTGASAGVHNSENIPLDGEIQSVYGSGGNGGNGGGGGAGASTAIIYEFTTDKAGSVNQEAYAREAGAGGPGGPGGRGADGCIIIFY